MDERKMGTVQTQFADLVWKHEPIGSGELVKLCEREWGWKKPTTYTVLRKLCERGIFQNENSVVTARRSAVSVEPSAESPSLSAFSSSIVLRRLAKRLSSVS